MKASLAAAKHAQAAESVATDVRSLKEQLDRIELSFNTLLEALAHDSVDTDSAGHTEPKRGRPRASEK